MNTKSSLLCFTIILLIIVLSGCSEKKKTDLVTFTSNSIKHSWALKDLKPELPSDWSEYEYLILDIKASSPQRFSLALHTDHGISAITILPFQKARIQMAIPLQFYRKPNTEGSEMAALYSRSLTTGWFNIWGVNIGPLTNIDSISVIMQSPINNPDLELFSFTLSKEKPVEKVIDPTILVDKFGQWIPDEWPGKIRSLKDLRQAWQKDDSLLQLQNVKRDKFGGFLDVQREATGFFRTEKIDGKWWFVDPEGHLFLATGINGVSPGDYTRTENREYIYAELPPQEFQRTGNDKGDAPQVSHGLWNQQRRYGDDWKNKWKSHTIKRMKAWGFNAINWSVPYLNDRVVYTKFTKGWGIEEGIMGFPDVYSQEFVETADKVAAEQCAPLKDDPWMLGYFLGNEPVWPGEESLIVDAFLDGPETDTKKVLMEFLADGDTPERRKEFIQKTFIRFLDIITRSIRKYDSNHLILGIRFGNLRISDEVIKMAKVFDVFSFNTYAYQLPAKSLDNVYELLDLPILVGEFHFGVPGKGLAPGLAQVQNQFERGVAYRNYVENAFSHPAVVSTFWYRWRDQTNTGRNDGENYNIGVVDVTDLMYTDLVDAIMITHKRVYDVHSGNIEPFSQLPEGRLE